MGIGAITKQLAQEALGTGVQNVLDTFSDNKPEAAAKPPDTLPSVILGEVNAMQNALKDDQELLVTCTIGATTLRVLELFVPSPLAIVVTGNLQGGEGVARLITPATALQLLCRPVPVKPDAKPVRIRLITPKAPTK